MQLVRLDGLPPLTRPTTVRRDPVAGRADDVEDGLALPTGRTTHRRWPYGNGYVTCTLESSDGHEVEAKAPQCRHCRQAR